jgi:transcriptional antiterminator RfaH
LAEHWYVAQLKAGREKVAIRGLNEQGFASYYPIMKSWRDRQGRWIQAPEPIFPRYLFLQSEPDPERWRSINHTRGVVRLLGNERPCPLPHGEVERLQDAERSGKLHHNRHRSIRTGDKVVFRVGAFVGLQGICQWTRRERIGVLLKVLGGDSLVQSPRDWLKLAAA